MQVSSAKPPPCGLYRTTRPHPTIPELGAGLLVNLHDCERGGGPTVFLPRLNEPNRWDWQKAGHAIANLGWLESLVSLPAEGFYLLRDELRFDGAVWPARALVQLGYDQAATPLLFLAQRNDTQNALVFA